MFDCCENQVHISQFPTEIIIHIFKFLPAKNLTVCREVCRRWKEVVDHFSSDDVLWEKYCERDFNSLYKDAKRKTNSCQLWFDIYRSLTLWGRLGDAEESRDEFCHSSVIADEIHDFSVLRNGLISVLKQASVVYYDISTLEMSDRVPIYGDYTKIVEYDDAKVILTSQLHLRIYRKLKTKADSKFSTKDEVQKEEKKVFYHTKYFTTFGRDIYFVNFENDVFHCNLDEELTETQYNLNYTDCVISVSLYNGCPTVVTLERNVYCYQNNAFEKLFNLECKRSNIFDFLWKYQFLDNIDWRVVYMWLASLRVTLPEGPLKYISMIKIYGDTFFIGCKNGILLIYYKPYVNGTLDFLSHKPVKQYRFSERDDIPVLSLHPIIKVDVIEIVGGHKVLVAMPKKIIVLTYKHNFEVVKSKVIMPYVPPGLILLLKE